MRTTKGIERRAARRVLAGVYRLADFSVAYQPAPELVWLVADRAIAEAQEADDPYAAERTSPETIRFNGYAREMLLSLAAAPPAGSTCCVSKRGWPTCSTRSSTSSADYIKIGDQPAFG
ncbi:MAG TPA: hypothetical protein VNA67_02710 [Pseudonocardiaceae bacterium]|nr:hypothetical protein [Pseudonocardiaceae bacterium]